MSDKDKIIAELKRDNEEIKKRLKDLENENKLLKSENENKLLRSENENLVLRLEVEKLQRQNEKIEEEKRKEEKDNEILALKAQVGKLQLQIGRMEEEKNNNYELRFSIWLSKLLPTGLREEIKKYPISEQLEIFNLPDKDRKEELNKMQNELTNEPSSTINDIYNVRNVSRYGLRNIVTDINLISKNITKEDAIELSKSVLPYCQMLTYLDLGGNPSIGDEGAAAVAAALSSNHYFKESLTELWLYGDNISDKGAKAISVALTHLTSLITLALGGNTIGDEGAKAIAGALPSLTKLTTLHLGSNTNITQEGKKAITDAIPAERQGKLTINVH